MILLNFALFLLELVCESVMYQAKSLLSDKAIYFLILTRYGHELWWFIRSHKKTPTFQFTELVHWIHAFTMLRGRGTIPFTPPPEAAAVPCECIHITPPLKHKPEEVNSKGI